MPIDSRDIFVFTDCDLDGAMSYLILQWLIGADIKYIVTKVSAFRDTFDAWYKNNAGKYKQIYILDIDVSDHTDLVDRENIVIFDHHDTHVRNIAKYKYAKTFVKSETSCAKLIYQILSRVSPHSISNHQKLLISLVDDYDSYTRKVPTSCELNSLFWTYSGNRVDRFINEFSQGFTGFNDEQQRIINFKKKAFESTVDDLEIYKLNNFEFSGGKYSVVSTIATSDINEIAQVIIDRYSCDIAIVINTRSGTVSFRKDRKCDVDLSILAGSVCATGGGHTASAGGKLDEKFLTFSKIFERIK